MNDADYTTRSEDILTHLKTKTDLCKKFLILYSSLQTKCMEYYVWEAWIFRSF